MNGYHSVDGKLFAFSQGNVLNWGIMVVLRRIRYCTVRTRVCLLCRTVHLHSRLSAAMVFSFAPALLSHVRLKLRCLVASTRNSLSTTSQIQRNVPTASHRVGDLRRGRGVPRNRYDGILWERVSVRPARMSCLGLQSRLKWDVVIGGSSTRANGSKPLPLVPMSPSWPLSPLTLVPIPRQVRPKRLHSISTPCLP